MKEAGTSDSELIASLLTIVIFFGLLWWKRRHQFGHAADAVRVYVNDQRLSCQVCQGEVFRKREGLVNTTWLTLFRLDFLNESAHCVCCLRCGYAHWFMSRETQEGRQSPQKWIRYETAPRPLQSQSSR